MSADAKARNPLRPRRVRKDMATAPEISEFHTSEISDGCPMHVRLRLEGKLIGDTPGALYRGQLFNDALGILYTRKAWDRGACESAIVAASKGIEAKSKVENRPFTPAVKDSLTTHNAEVLALVVQYAQRFAPRVDDRVIGVELPVRFTLEHPALDEPAEFASHLDLLYRRGDGRIVCPDFKLRKDSPSPAFLARWPQGAIYWLAIRYGTVLVDGEWLEFGEWPVMQWIDATNLSPYGKAYTNPNTGESFKKGDIRPEARIVLHAPFLPQGEQAARDMLAERVAMMRAGFFPAMPDPETCGFCDARAFCPQFAGGPCDE